MTTDEEKAIPLTTKKLLLLLGSLAVVDRKGEKDGPARGVFVRWCCKDIPLMEGNLEVEDDKLIISLD